MTLPPRILNRTGRGHCRYCGDGGYVVVAVRDDRWSRKVRTGKGEKETKLVETTAEVEEYAPCPFCERGLAEEFPDPSRATNSKPIKSPWGEQGYWRGREPVDVRPLDESDNLPLPPEENARRMRELQERLEGVGREMPF